MEMTLLIGLDAASYILTLLLVCIGLVIIFGMMNVINLAHGEFFLLGAYTVVLLQQYALPFAVILLAAFAFVALIGLIIKRSSSDAFTTVFLTQSSLHGAYLWRSSSW